MHLQRHYCFVVTCFILLTILHYLTKIFSHYLISVDGGWGQWCAWSKCSKSCGGGIKKRSRKCDNPLPLYGGNDCGYDFDAEASCNTEPCPREL